MQQLITLQLFWITADKFFVIFRCDNFFKDEWYIYSGNSWIYIHEKLPIERSFILK